MTSNLPYNSARLKALAALAADAHARLKLKFGIRLWDGKMIPQGYPETGLAIAINDEAVVTQLLRRPSLDTLLKAYIAGRAAIINGSIFDLAAARPEAKPGRIARQLGYRRIAATAARFLFAPAKAPAAPSRAGGNPFSRDGSPETNKANIAHHYDVSNDFYRLFLDEEMVYTCAYFTADHGDLARAQIDKLDMVCRKLRLTPGETFLDIGCGWGALVCHAAQHYGVHATGVTLAEEQLALAREKVERLGLRDKVTLVLQDYAKMEGAFDKIASIGMFEHVGIKNHAGYFRAVHRLLKPRGLYLHHAISRPAKKDDKSFNRLKPEYKALIKYIFPGGELDHLGMAVANLERFKFEVHDVEGWREHYQRTTRLWWERLEARKAEAEKIVGPEKTRIWLLYLAGCSLAFERSAAGVFQTLASKKSKGASGLPLSRADLYR